MLRQNEFSVLLMLSFNLCAQQLEVSRTGDFGFVGILQGILKSSIFFSL